MGCSKLKNKNCGCASSSLVTPASCNENTCKKEPCSEMFSDECIIHIQKDMSVINSEGKKISLNNGDRLMSFLQKLMVMSVSTDSIDSKDIPSGIRIDSVTKDTIVISWDLMSEVNMSLKYKQSSAVEWNSKDVTNQNTYTLSNLTSGIEYNICLSNIDNSIDSIIITLKTL